MKNNYYFRNMGSGFGKVLLIYEGYKNLAVPDPKIEVLGNYRALWCGSCEFSSIVKGKGIMCEKCWCFIPAKIRVPGERCPIKKWNSSTNITMNANTFLSLSDFSAEPGWIYRLMNDVSDNVTAPADVALIQDVIDALTAERNYVHGAAVLNDGITEVAPTAVAGSAADLPAARNAMRLILNEYEQNILINFVNPATNDITAYNTTMAANRATTLAAFYALYAGL